MAKLRINGVSACGGTLISSLEAGDTFVFEGSAKGNNGVCIRLKDSKKGKSRFVNVASGKVLTATCRDYGRPVDANLTYDA